MWFYQVSLISQSLRARVHLSLAWSDIFIIVMSDWNDGELKVARIFLDFFFASWEMEDKIPDDGQGDEEVKHNNKLDFWANENTIRLLFRGRVRWNSQPKKQIFYQNCSCGSFFVGRTSYNKQFLLPSRKHTNLACSTTLVQSSNLSSSISENGQYQSLSSSHHHSHLTSRTTLPSWSFAFSTQWNQHTYISDHTELNIDRDWVGITHIY